MFRKKETRMTPVVPVMPVERVTTVLGSGTTYKGSLSGSGGARIEGAFEGEINLRGMLVIGATGRVTCPHVKANVVIIAGALRGDITAEKVEIRSSGRVWGNVITAAFSTEEGAFLRGQIQMEEKVEIEPLQIEKEAADSVITLPEAQQGIVEESRNNELTVESAAENRLEAAVDTLHPQPVMRPAEPQRGFEETLPNALFSGDDSAGEIETRSEADHDDQGEGPG